MMDVFLSVIAKTLTEQVKVKGKNGATSNAKETTTMTLQDTIGVEDYVANRWWLRGTYCKKLTEDIVAMINDLVSV